MTIEEVKRKKTLIDKYFNKKRENCLLDLYIEDIDDLAFYFILNKVTKADTYRLYWINITAMSTDKVEDWVNSNLVYPSKVEEIKSILLNNQQSKESNKEEKNKSFIELNFYFSDIIMKKNTYQFYRYIPPYLGYIADILFIVFESTPKYMFQIFQIMIERMVNPDINCVFVYDLEKDDIDKLFDKDSINKGKKIYKNNDILFIEKYLDVNYATIKAEINELVSVIYHEDTKEVQFTCTCEKNHICEHIYATLLAIKNNDKKSFYKIAYIDENKDIINNLKDLNYLLCAGIYDDSFVVISNFGYQLVPILTNNKLNFKILEDDDENNLEITLNEYLEKNNIDIK